MFKDTKEMGNIYSSSLKHYEKLLPTSQSIPKLLQTFESQRDINLRKEKALRLRNKILFFQNFEQLVTGSSSANLITPSLSAPKINVQRWIKIKENRKIESINSQKYAQTEKGNTIDDIFNTHYIWKKDKPKYKPRIFKLRLGLKRQFDIKNYTPNYSAIYKQTFAAKINPLPQKALPILKRNKNESMMKRTICNKYFKTIDERINEVHKTRNNKLTIKCNNSVKCKGSAKLY